MVLISGGSGIVGGRILFDLVSAGKQVKALKRLNSDLDFVKKTFRFYSPEKGEELFNQIIWVDADILELDALIDAFENVDEVYHAAAKVSYQSGEQDSLIETNYAGTANMVNIALDFDVKKFCHISSVSALGLSVSSKLITESDTWKREDGTSAYGLSKFMAEREVWRGIAEGLNAVIVNPSIILGPAKADQSSGALMSILKKGISYYPIGATGFVDVRDVSRICILLMNSEINAQRFILNSENLPYKTLLDTAAAVYKNKEPQVKFHPWMLELIWMMTALWANITGSNSSITKETARSASRINRYDNFKIKAALETDFISVKDSLSNYHAFV